MERKIGEIFEYNGEWYQCVKADVDEHSCNGCQGCKGVGGPYIFGGECNGNAREDGNFVIFKKLEKVGEPITVKGRTFQKLISDNYSCANCVFNTQDKGCHKPYYIDGLCFNNEIWVEVKQNKEDMEEKKLNLKPFDLEAAKAGKTVCTRDGRKVRIICFDAKRKDENSIIALVPSKDYPGFEDLIAYPNNGNYYGGHENDGDLMMLPEKKEGYVNLYHNCNDRYAAYLGNNVIYKDKEFAEDMGRGDINYIKTVKVQWEE